MKRTSVINPVKWLASRDGRSIVWIDVDQYVFVGDRDEPASTDPARYVHRESFLAQTDWDDWMEVKP